MLDRHCYNDTSPDIMKIFYTRLSDQADINLFYFLNITAYYNFYDINLVSAEHDLSKCSCYLSYY